MASLDISECIHRYVPELRLEARWKPINYLQVREEKRIAEYSTDTHWVYLPEVDAAITAEYDKYKPTFSDIPMERISGCCDRADQY